MKLLITIKIVAILLSVIFSLPSPCISDKYSCRGIVVDTFTYRGTYYNAEIGQTDSDPLTVACGWRIPVMALKEGNLRWCAVSRDLLKKHPLGSYIYIHHFDPLISGWWMVVDKMGRFRGKKRRKITNSIDFLVSSKIKSNISKLRVTI